MNAAFDRRDRFGRSVCLYGDKRYNTAGQKKADNAVILLIDEVRTEAV